MSLSINLAPEYEASLRALAAHEGVDARELARRFLEEWLSTAAPVNGLHGQSARHLTREEMHERLRAAGARFGNRAEATTLLRQWLSEDGTNNPDAIRAAEQELEEFKLAMNENRARTGERPVYE